MHGTLAIPAAIGAPRNSERAPVRSADELCRAVRDGRNAPLSLDTRRLDRVLRLDPARDRVEAQSATTWRTLAAHAAHVLPELAAFAADAWLPATIGESLAANAPGPDGCPLVEHIEAVALVTPDGQLRRASREADADLFALALGGHGAFGVPYSVTLRPSSLARAAARRTRNEILEIDPGSDAPTHDLVLYVPPDRLESFLAAVRLHAREWRMEIARVEVRPTQPETETRLCWARRAYAAVALRLRLPSGLGGQVRTVQTHHALVDAAIAHGGSFDLGADAHVSRGQVEACYPMIRAFFAEKTRYDPDGRLENRWTRRYRALLRREACEVRWDH
jgi:FAD/FMN-containing dehydrogenase